MTPEAAIAVLQLGGVLAFAFVVWAELRTLRLEAREDRKELRAILGELRDDMVRVSERTGPVHRAASQPAALER